MPNKDQPTQIISFIKLDIQKYDLPSQRITFLK